MRFKVGQRVRTLEYSEGVKIGEIGTVITAEKKANVEIYVVAFGASRQAHYTRTMMEGVGNAND